MVDMELSQQQSSAITHLCDTEIEDCRIKLFVLRHPCYDQTVKRHVKFIMKASVQVTGFDREGLIRQKIRSLKLMKKFDTKMQFS